MGSPLGSELAEPFSCTVCAPLATVWFEPAFATGGWLAGGAAVVPHASISARPMFCVPLLTVRIFRRRLVVALAGNVIATGPPLFGNVPTLTVEPSENCSVPERI